MCKRVRFSEEAKQHDGLSEETQSLLNLLDDTVFRGRDACEELVKHHTNADYELMVHILNLLNERFSELVDSHRQKVYVITTGGDKKSRGITWENAGRLRALCSCIEEIVGCTQEEEEEEADTERGLDVKMVT